MKKKVIVAGKDRIDYIVNANGKRLTVRKGDIITFKDSEEADKAISEIKTFDGIQLLHPYEIKNDEKGVKTNAKNG